MKMFEGGLLVKMIINITDILLSRVKSLNLGGTSIEGESETHDTHPLKNM